jgi:hypothetical protein
MESKAVAAAAAIAAARSKPRKEGGREGGEEEAGAKEEEEEEVIIPAMDREGRPLMGAGGREADLRREDMRRGTRQGKTKVGR